MKTYDEGGTCFQKKANLTGMTQKINNEKNP
jgi:hypothetical protein